MAMVLGTGMAAVTPTGHVTAPWALSNGLPTCWNEDGPRPTRCGPSAARSVELALVEDGVEAGGFAVGGLGQAFAGEPDGGGAVREVVRVAFAV